MTIFECTEIKYKKKKVIEGSKFNDPESIANFIKNSLGLFPIEKLWVFGLDNRNRLIAFFEAASGGTSSAAFNAGEVAKKLLLMNCSCFIVAHNHPGGSLVFSPEDRAMTKNLKAGLKLLDVNLIDHVLVTEDGFLSMSSSCGI
jgi:DNA repair protein RadC